MAADSPDYNAGRLEGRADVAAMLREVLGPKHQKDNLVQLIAVVEVLAAVDLPAVDSKIDAVRVLLDALNEAGGEASMHARKLAEAIGITLEKAAPQVPVQIGEGLPFLIRFGQDVFQVRPMRWDMHRDVHQESAIDSAPTYMFGETRITLDLVVDHRFEEAKEKAPVAATHQEDTCPDCGRVQCHGALPFPGDCSAVHLRRGSESDPGNFAACGASTGTVGRVETVTCVRCIDLTHRLPYTARP